MSGFHHSPLLPAQKSEQSTGQCSRNPDRTTRRFTGEAEICPSPREQEALLKSAAFGGEKPVFFLPFKSSLHVRPRQPTELSDTQERALGGKTERNRPEKKRLQVSGKETLSPSGWGLSRAMCDHQCDISSVTLAVTVPR